MSKLMQQPLMHYLAPLKADFLSIALLSLVANLLMLAPTIYMLQLYDRVIMSKNELTLITLTLLIGIFILAIAFAEWLRSMITIRAGVKLDQSLNSLLFGLAFERAFNQKSDSQQKNASEAIQDLTYIRQFLTSNGLFAFFDMPWTLIYVAVLFILNPSLGWLAVVFCLIQFALGVWNQASTDKPLKASMQAHLKSQQFLQSKIRNLETLHVMGILPQLYKRWQNLQATSSQLNSQATKTQGRNQHINKFARYTMQSLMLAAAALLAVKGQISMGSMIASNVLIARALQPFDVVVSTWKQTIQAKVAFGRLNALLTGVNVTHAEVTHVEAFAPIKGDIALKNLNVTLQAGNKKVLNNLSAHIPSGQILTIMGPSGSGKTTLARCLVGVITVEHGALLVDGISIEQINQQQLVSSLGYLPQDIDLIEGTIAENIARFWPLDSLEIIAAAKTVGIHDTILRLPLGYDTKIDEAGLALSGGQSQLVSLARAIYKEPAIIVLDEPNAHLDEHGDKHLLRALLALKSKGKTIVVISHRANILKVTDQLLVMKSGEIHHHGPTKIVLSKLNDALPKIKQQAA
jgi:ATP-binding cassette subfamily C exporter for protease/lipase